MDLIELTTNLSNNKKDGIKIHVRLLDSLKNNKMPNPEKINGIIKKEFNNDFNLQENARRILNELQPYCLEVKIIPPAKGFSYHYTIISRK